MLYPRVGVNDAVEIDWRKNNKGNRMAEKSACLGM